MVNEKSGNCPKGERKFRIPLKRLLPILWERLLDFADELTGRAEAEDRYLADLADKARCSAEPSALSHEEICRKYNIES